MADDETNATRSLTAIASGAEALARGADLDQALEALVGAAAATPWVRTARRSACRTRTDRRPTDVHDRPRRGQPGGPRRRRRDARPPAHGGRPRSGRGRRRRGVAYPLIVGRGGIEQSLGAVLFHWSWGRPQLSDGDAAFLRATADMVAVAVEPVPPRFDDRRTVGMVRAPRPHGSAHGPRQPADVRPRPRLELARAGRQGGEVSVAIFDVDDFAATNAAGGREAGDDVLRSVASVLAGAVRLVDTVARLGGDEFLVAPGSARSTVARRVLDGIAELAEIGGRRVSVSAGVARFPAETGPTARRSSPRRRRRWAGRAEGRGSLETTPG